MDADPGSFKSLFKGIYLHKNTTHLLIKNAVEDVIFNNKKKQKNKELLYNRRAYIQIDFNCLKFWFLQQVSSSIMNFIGNEELTLVNNISVINIRPFGYSFPFFQKNEGRMKGEKSCKTGFQQVFFTEKVFILTLV